MTRSAARLVIQGRVQGVGYRWWTVRVATELGVAGWVRNCADGSVEVLAIGGDDQVERLKAFCRRGPRGAVVRSVDIAPAEDDGSASFVQRETL